jgi:cytochrome c556
MRVSLKGVICAIVITAIGGVALASFPKSEDAIEYRKSVMTVIGHHFGSLATVVKEQTPYDRKAVEHNAMVIKTMAELPWDAMMYPGSAKGHTTLKASALKEKDKFMREAQELESATQKLEETAADGDLSTVKAQFGIVAGVCKDCHSTFRKK